MTKYFLEAAESHTYATFKDNILEQLAPIAKVDDPAECISNIYGLLCGSWKSLCVYANQMKIDPPPANPPEIFYPISFLEIIIYKISPSIFKQPGQKPFMYTLEQLEEQA